MSKAAWAGWVRRSFAVALVGMTAASAPGATIWNKNTSGLWSDGGNWNIGVPPNIARGTTYITNGVSKTVTVDATTMPTNLLITTLVIAAPPNVTNTLKLVDLGPARPLALANNSLTIARGGALSITNSSLVVTGRFIDFNMWAGSVTLDSGSLVVREQPLTTNVTVVTRIGRTNAATVTINGGLMDVTQLLVGETPGVQYARSQGTIHLVGGTLSVGGELSIGTGLGCTGIVDVAGGQLLVANQQTNVMRIGDQGFGQLTIANASAQVGNVSVARHDSSRGVLVLQPGGVMTCSDDVSIGRFSGSTGLVFVAGGDLTVTNHPIWVGREGRGQLVISNGLLHAETLNVAVVPTNTAFGLVTVGGGTMLVSSNFVLGDEALSVGQVLVADGNLSITNGTGTAQLTINSGVFTLNGGALAADNLTLGNSAGQFVFNGGTLHSKGSFVSNGLPFVIGNGGDASTFELQGGTHVFANGLVIASNARLIGCGTVVGAITVQPGGANLLDCGGTGTMPSIVQQPSGLTVVQGDPVTLTVSASGTAPLSYQWRFKGNAIGNATGSNFVIAAAQPSDAGSYDVIVSNSAGSATSVMVNLTVLVPPTITAQPISQVVTQGGTASFEVAADGSPPLSYQWRFGIPGQGGGNLPGATQSKLVLNNAQPTNAGNYRVLVSNAAGTVTSVVATLTVLVPPAVAQNPKSQTVLPGASVTFTVMATGTGTLNYQWRHNGVNISGATGDSFTIGSAQAADAGGYDVLVSNAAGSTTSASAALRVLISPRITDVSAAVNTFSLTFESVSGLSYTIESKNELAAPDWTTLTTRAGTGNPLTVIDPDAAVPMRFYRIRVE